MTRGTKARYFISGLLAAVVFVPVVILAGDTIPLTFKSGDIISALVMNQLFARINATTQLPTQQSLMGVWKCAETLPGTQWLNPPSTYTLDATGLFATRQNTLTFAAGGSANALTVTSTAGVPLQDDNYLLNSSAAAVAPNTRLVTVSVPAHTMQGGVSNTGGIVVYVVTGVATDQFELKQDGEGTATCQKANIPPAPVSSVTDSVSGSSVTLSWVDSNTDQTGYIVQRSADNGSTWMTIATISDPATLTYVDAALTTGTYEYSVLATNTYGSSISSTVVGVTIP